MTTHFLLRSLVFLLLLVSLSGCASQPWTTPVGQQDSRAFTTIFHQMQARDNQCPPTLEADITISWTTPMEKRSIGGFLQLMAPSSLKFITTNPLGQPLYALATDGHTFQSINTLESKFMGGGLDSLLLFHDIPLDLLSEQLTRLFTGRLPKGDVEILAVRDDGEKRGIWLTIAFQDGKIQRQSHLLINMVEKRLLSRMILESPGKSTEEDREPVATLSYSGWLNRHNCPIPTTLKITDFIFGSQLDIGFSEIGSNPQLKQSHFSIKPPPGYLRQLLP